MDGSTRAGCLREAGERKEALRTRFRDLADRRELLEMHLGEIEKVAPEEGEEEQLEALRAEWRSTEQVRRQYERAQMILRGEETGLPEQVGHLERALETADDDEMAAYLEAASSFRQTLAELERKLRRPPLPQSEADPEYIEGRLFELAQLKRKLHRTLPEILSLRDEIQDNLSFLDACTLDIRQVEKEEKALRGELADLLTRLNAQRRQAAAAFTERLEQQLTGLGFSQHVKVIAEWSTVELFPGCQEDRVRLLWSPNPGQQPQPLDKIASGGELSRFMLAVVSIQTHSEEATLIFDEVDAGVGGLTLNRVAEQLEALSSRRQMVLITHWPQLASRAVRHFRVTKEVHDGKTFTRCFKLNPQEREAELARMVGIEK